MKLIISEKLTNQDPTICLNMIVKNESHIIKNTLEKLCSKIKFSYWVICDTGSTDNTREIIIEFFKSKNIPGELHEDQWKDFAYNRTQALIRAFQKTDLLLVFDADDEIVGNIEMPKVGDTIYDEYHLKFGSPIGTAYTRVLLINNKKRFIYQSVLHEFICCIEPTVTTNTVIKGDYYVVSGRSGNRSKDPEKYLKDAKILEAAHAEALKENNPLYLRYAFYCANSYKDYGSFDEAIKWYKITLNQENWEQEKYVSCLYIYECCLKINQQELGFFYLIKAFKYDTERVECLYPLLVHYCCEDQHRIAYNYYLNIKDFFENQYLNTDIDKKLFITSDKYNFFVPYYMILIADKVQDFECVVKMFEIVFTKKMPIIDIWHIRNFLYNLQFFVAHVKPENKDKFTALANDYFHFLYDLGVPLNTIECLKDYDIRFGIDVSYIFFKNVEKKMIFSKEECKKSKNIMFYTGFADVDWNYSYTKNHALGGSEKAAAYLSKELAALLLLENSSYNVYVTGVVQNEKFDNVTYVSLHNIPNLIQTIPFNTVICSRYISFLEIFKDCSFDQFYIWGHDTQLIHYGCNLTDKQLISKWDKYITGCICQTEWHSTLFKGLYPELSNKISIINNGLDIQQIISRPTTSKKQSNKFIYSSRPERGLDKLLELWPQILTHLPDSELVISNYGIEPNQIIMDIIKKYDNIKYLGKLNTVELYNEMQTAEYWLYPTGWPETSCITALEMLMSKVICLYYPIAGLPFTIKDHGIQIAPGNEIEKLINLTTKEKQDLREKGKEYALSCSWTNRAKEWVNVLSLSKYEKENEKNEENEEKEVIDKHIIDRIQYLHDNLSIPRDHVEYLKKLCKDEHFSPNVIYDIGSNVLHWTKEARLIWPNAKIIAFDAIKTAEFLYKEYNLQYFTGVLSDSDNKTVNFYENMEMPGGNSYYKEIGHSKAEEMFPETKYTKSKTITLSSAVKKYSYPFPDLIKIDVQGSELDIIKGSLDVINRAKYLIVELQHEQYNRGAPLADTTIQFLEKNDWELVANKFCNNGPDADYCFKNKKFNKDFKWLFILPSFFINNILNDYFDNLKTIYNIEYTNDENVIYFYNPTKVTFINTINMNLLNYCNNNNIEVSLFNTEPLTINDRLQYIIQNYKLQTNIKMYDYSKSNIRILNENGITNTEYIPYVITKEETQFLKYNNANTTKIYDFGIILRDYNCERRTKVIEFLTGNGFTVHVICNKWKEERDIELAKCKIILNIHGQYLNTPSDIFEHLRCDRLLEAGYNILSETNYYLDRFYIEKFKENLQIINYNDFFNLETYKNINLTLNKYIQEDDTTNTNSVGFIILRHVNNQQANKYWQHSYDCIRVFYPENLILIIDDNSDYNYITAKELYKTTIINSEYPGRGDLLPYYYYLQNKLFDTAVILHDTAFINTYIDFTVNKYKFIWDFQHHWDQIEDETKMINLFNDPELLSFYENKSLWKGCLNGMSIITHDFLTLVHNKYDLKLLLNVVLNKYNCSSFERVIGCLLNKIYKNQSLFGDIHEYSIWGIAFDEIENYHLPIIKIF